MITEKSLTSLQQAYPNLLEIDANLDRLIRRIELLSYVNPLNIEKEKNQQNQNGGRPTSNRKWPYFTNFLLAVFILKIGNVFVSCVRLN